MGARVGNYYIVKTGLKEGEEAVTEGNFKIDSAMQIAAKPSMMNPEGEIPATGHERHSMDTKSEMKPLDENQYNRKHEKHE